MWNYGLNSVYLITHTLRTHLAKPFIMSARYLSLLLCLTFFFSSCTEEYDLLDTTDINTRVQDRQDIETPEELILLFYDHPPGTRASDITVRSENYGNNEYRIELEHDPDRGKSYRAIRYVLLARLRDRQWFVSEIRRSSKCHQTPEPARWQPGRCG